MDTVGPRAQPFGPTLLPAHRAIHRAKFFGNSRVNKKGVSRWGPLKAQTPELAGLDLKERETICGP
ncbi:MAG: hypothetical protein AAGA88_10995 [Pseudomonadota bacterium]